MDDDEELERSRIRSAVMEAIGPIVAMRDDLLMLAKVLHRGSALYASLFSIKSSVYLSHNAEWLFERDRESASFLNTPAFASLANVIRGFRFFQSMLDDFWGAHLGRDFPCECDELDEIVVTMRMLEDVLDTDNTIDGLLLRCLRSSEDDETRQRAAIVAIWSTIKRADQVCRNRMYLHAARLMRTRGKIEEAIRHQMGDSDMEPLMNDTQVEIEPTASDPTSLAVVKEDVLTDVEAAVVKLGQTATVAAIRMHVRRSQPDVSAALRYLKSIGKYLGRVTKSSPVRSRYVPEA